MLVIGRIRFFGVIFGVCCLASQMAPAQNTIRPVLRSTYGDFFPYSFTGAGGHAEGYIIDVISNLANDAGYDVTFVEAQNPRQFLEMLAADEIDITPFLGLTPERISAGLATNPLGKYELNIFMRRDRMIEHAQHLSGKRIGAVSGAATRTAAELIPFAHILEFETTEAMLLPLLSGDLDAVIAVSESFQERLRTNYIEDKVRSLEPALLSIPYGIIVNEKLPDVHMALNTVIKETVTPTALAALHENWFGRDRSIVDHPWFNNVALIVGGITLTLLALTIYAVRLYRRSGRLLAEHGANQLLVDALNGVRAGITIFDHEMKAVHWNRGFKRSFPELAQGLSEGASLRESWERAYASGELQTEMDETGAAAFAAEIEKDLKAGESLHRSVRTKDGDTYEVSEFRLGKQHYASIWVDVSALHRQQTFISAQSEELKEKNRQLMAFSTIAAHDLRAPLMQQNTLIDFIFEDFAEAQIELKPEIRSHFKLLKDLSHRMAELVGDLLEHARAGEDNAPPECFCPTDRFEQTLKLAVSRSGFTVHIAPDMPEVCVNPMAFDMVMRNLISNATKHHDRSEGHIRVRARGTATEVIFDVEDDGPGIPKSEHAKIFEPFARLTKIAGTGLGLAFIQKTVTGWGGSVTVSDAPERGSIFSVSIPRSTSNVVALTRPASRTALA